MEKKQLLSMEFFSSLHHRESFFEKITDEKNAAIKILNHFVVLILFSLVYGAVMGCYNGYAQAISSGIKLPILFSLIIIICFPAFFVIQTILGSKLTLSQMLSVILSGFVLTTSIMVSFAPIVIFFLITGGNYAFIKLLHVGIFILAGMFGMRTIIEALKFSCEKKNIYPKIGVQVFKFWIVILAFVGAQLSWSLRPFIGAKELPFTVFRQKGGNFYQEVLQSAVGMFEKQNTSTETKQVKDRQIENDMTTPTKEEEINN